MEQYNVFIIALKEILSGWAPVKIGFIAMAIIIAYRLPELIAAIKL